MSERNAGARGNVAPPAGDLERRRLERWRTAHDMDAESFARRLASAGLDEQHLLTLMSETAEQLSARVPRPPWAAEVEAVVAEVAAPPPVPGEPGVAAGPAGAATAGDAAATAGDAAATAGDAAATAGDAAATAGDAAATAGSPATPAGDAAATAGSPATPAGDDGAPTAADGAPAADDGAPAADDGAPAADEFAWYRGFAAVLTPFVTRALRRVEAAGTPDHAAGPTIVAELANRLYGGLVTHAARTLVLELNVLRVTDRLTGTTADERFASFVSHYSKAENLAALFEEYPVLARLLAEEASQTVDAHLEMMARYAEDRADLVSRVLDGVDPGPLVSVNPSGDTHRGRAVTVLRFASGARVVYKPRPLAVHSHFNDVLVWLNGLIPGLDLRRLRLLTRAAYGWIEFAEHGQCADRSGVERYYRRQGALLALLHVLEGADFHFENLIACGDQPVLIDLEALLHPAPKVDAPDWLAGDPAMQALSRSVDRISLLPRLMVGENGAMDLSGMGGDKGAQLPVNGATWAGAGTDEMRLVRTPQLSPGGNNRPQVDGVDADPAEHLDNLLAGFAEAYDTIAAHREGLVGPDGLLWRFATDEIRVVLRPTTVYGTLLQESTHPDALRDALDRDRIFDFLWAASGGEQLGESLVAYENAEMWRGDVPIFTSRPDSTAVRTTSGVALVDALEDPSIERAARKIGSLGLADRRRQEWIIKASMAVRSEADFTVGTIGALVGIPADPADGAEPEQLVAAARLVADEIMRRRYDDGERVNWLGLSLIEEKHWMVLPLPFELYDGYPGVALFLAQLAAVTGDERYADVARRAVAPLPAVVDSLREPPAPRSPGGFSGPAGLAYTLAHLATLLDDPGLTAPIEAVVELCRAAVAADEALDVIGGSAGCLAAMLAVHEATGLAAAREVADACAARLVERAEPAAGGIAWKTPMSEVPLTGFSHGAAGIGWALARHAAATGRTGHLDLVEAAFAYERGLYDASTTDWPDLRSGPVEPGRPAPRMHAWCHGAPGIGLARADALRRLGPAALTPAVAADLDLAIRSVTDAGPMAGHSLCHGELGNLELLAAATALGHAEAAEHHRRRAAQLVEQLDRGGPVCGTPGGIGTPGLLTGYAGIGHGLLRLAFPARVPAALLLDPPGKL